jgi:hypothetical protein
VAADDHLAHGLDAVLEEEGAGHQRVAVRFAHEFVSDQHLHGFTGSCAVITIFIPAPDRDWHP